MLVQFFRRFFQVTKCCMPYRPGSVNLVGIAGTHGSLISRLSAHRVAGSFLEVLQPCKPSHNKTCVAVAQALD